ncbi:hypothetical protein [Microbacterium trichothecenolyticum]|uniref:hypothetical protein n=1 Tax=Microbacterium trichothecenolyticum TaxID=69370 RepID=UPI0012EEAC3E|nr:hypothetical protein [Microbacterium trichothecenolyticum]
MKDSEAKDRNNLVDRRLESVAETVDVQGEAVSGTSIHPLLQHDCDLIGAPDQRESLVVNSVAEDFVWSLALMCERYRRPCLQSVGAGQDICNRADGSKARPLPANPRVAVGGPATLKDTPPDVILPMAISD